MRTDEMARDYLTRAAMTLEEARAAASKGFYSAILVYDRDRFFASVLERLRKRLDELGSKRVRMGRKWYWILKPDYRFGEVIELG